VCVRAWVGWGGWSLLLLAGFVFWGVWGRLFVFALCADGGIQLSFVKHSNGLNSVLGVQKDLFCYLCCPLFVIPFVLFPYFFFLYGDLGGVGGWVTKRKLLWKSGWSGCGLGGV